MIVQVNKQGCDYLITSNTMKIRSNWEGTYLHNGDVKEGPAEANDNGSHGHHSRAGEEPHGHGERGDRIPTCDYLGLKSHKQTFWSHHKHKKKRKNQAKSQSEMINHFPFNGIFPPTFGGE